MINNCHVCQAEQRTRREGRGCTGNAATREMLIAAVVVVEFVNASLIDVRDVHESKLRVGKCTPENMEYSWNDHNAPGKHEVQV